MDVLKKLSISEIARFMNDDETSDKKRFARIGQKYYEGDHDIRHYRIFYYDANGDLQEDTARANVKIPHAVKFDVNDGFHAVSPTGDSAISSYLPDLSQPGAVKKGEVEMVAASVLKNTAHQFKKDTD